MTGTRAKEIMHYLLGYANGLLKCLNYESRDDIDDTYERAMYDFAKYLIEVLTRGDVDGRD